MAGVSRVRRVGAIESRPGRGTRRIVDRERIGIYRASSARRSLGLTKVSTVDSLHSDRRETHVGRRVRIGGTTGSAIQSHQGGRKYSHSRRDIRVVRRNVDLLLHMRHNEG